MPGLSARLDAALETMAKKKTWNLIAHGGMVLFTLICVGVVWWSISYRLPQLAQESAGLRESNQLRNQIEQLRLRSDTAIEQRLNARLQAQNRDLFRDRKAVVAWLKREIEAAERSGMALHYSLDGMQPALITHHAMTVQLKLTVTPRAGSSNFARMIRFVERMRHNGKALHIDRVSMRGNATTGASSMDLQLRLWMV